jgi:hypothetical protein
VCGPVDKHLTDAFALTKHRKYPSFPPNPMHAYSCHVPWAICIRPCHTTERAQFPALKNGDLSAKGETPHRKKHGFSRICGGWLRTQNLTQTNYLTRNPKMKRQRPHRTVKTMTIHNYLTDGDFISLTLLPPFISGKFQIFISVRV